jgi:recombination protein RecA
VSAQILALELPALPVINAVPLAEQLPIGKLIEIARTADGAQMTLAVACVRQAQLQGEPVAWVQRAGGALFPPDLADSGIDLDALLVVHAPAVEHNLAKAAELLLRSGAFGMVVIDLTASGDSAASPQSSRDPLELAVQSRLLGLAREHRSHVLLLSERGAAGNRGGSLGPLISLCIEPKRTRVARGEFALAPRARKDKSGLLCALASETRRGPWGLW